MNNNFYRKKADKMQWAEATIGEIMKKNIAYDSGSIKNEFKVNINNSEFICTYWAHTNINTGYLVRIKFWNFKENFLLIDRMIILDKGEQK